LAQYLLDINIGWQIKIPTLQKKIDFVIQ